jgi:hypothetical protein
MEETVPTIHMRMVRRNIDCVKKRQETILSHLPRNKSPFCCAAAAVA